MKPVFDPYLGKIRNSDVDESEVRTIVEAVVDEKMDKLKHKYVAEEEKMYLDGAGPKQQ